jgi:hypothetical protein
VRDEITGRLDRRTTGGFAKHPFHLRKDSARTHRDRNTHSQQQRAVRAQVHVSDANAFFNLSVRPELLDKLESLLAPLRERRSPPTETLSMFLVKALSTCRSHALPTCAPLAIYRCDEHVNVQSQESFVNRRLQQEKRTMQGAMRLMRSLP